MYVGNNGGISISEAEASWGAGGAALDTLFGISSSLGLKKSLIEPKHLFKNPQGSTDYTPSFVDGEISCHWSAEYDVMHNLLASFFRYDTSAASGWNRYATSSSPEIPYCHIDVGFGSDSGGSIFREKFHGCIATSFNFELNPNEYPVVTMGYVGKYMAHMNSSPGTYPAIAHLTAPSVFSYIRTNVDDEDYDVFPVKAVSISAERPYATDRVKVGSSYIELPVQNGKTKITGSLTMDLSDDDPSGNDSISSVELLDKFLAGGGSSDLNYITLGNAAISGAQLSLANSRIVGEMPSIGEGVTEFTLNFESTVLNIKALANDPADE